MINPHIFREYDIRGRVDADLSPEVANLLGRGVGTALIRGGGRRFVMGRDNRLSSPAYHDEMTAGLVETGVEVLDIGMVPTPLMYYALHHLDTDGGVIVTGSHNPPDYNGFKVAIGKATIWGEKIQEIRRLMEEGDFETGAGSIADHDIITPYRDMIPRQTAAHCRRRRERRRRARRTAHLQRAGLRGDRTVLPARRHLPRPLSRPHDP